MKIRSFKDEEYTDLLFDLDRTLWDFERNARETFMDMYYKYQLVNYFEDFNNFYSTYREYNEELWHLYRSGRINKETLSWKRFDLTLKDIDVVNEELARALAQSYLDISPTKTKLFPHTITSLTYLKKKYRMHLVTNGFKEVQSQKIINSGLDKLFDNLYTSEEVGVQKPHPEYFEYVLNAVGSSPEKCLMIGDDLNVDIKGANNYGITSVWFNYNGLNSEKLESTDVKPTTEINSLKELILIL